MNAGIYVVRLSDTHYYGGRTRDARRRWKTHKDLLDAGEHYNTFMQRVYDLHKRYEPEIIVPLTEHEDQEVFEQYWLDANIGQPGCVNVSYNARGPSPLTLTGAQRGKIGIPHTAESRAKIGAAHKGRKKSPEWCAKISLGKTGKPHAPHSAETRAKIGAGRLGKKQPPHVGLAVSAANRRRYEERVKSSGQIGLFGGVLSETS